MLVFKQRQFCTNTEYIFIKRSYAVWVSYAISNTGAGLTPHRIRKSQRYRIPHSPDEAKQHEGHAAGRAITKPTDLHFHKYETEAQNKPTFGNSLRSIRLQTAAGGGWGMRGNLGQQQQQREWSAEWESELSVINTGRLTVIGGVSWLAASCHNWPWVRYHGAERWINHSWPLNYYSTWDCGRELKREP